MKNIKIRSSGIFRKYFTATISIILASFVFIGGALLLLVSKLWMDEKSALLQKNAENVASYTGTVFGSETLLLNGSDSMRLICNTIANTSEAIDADVFITTPTGDVVFCKDTFREDFVFYSGECQLHSAYRISPSILQKALYETCNTTGSLDGSAQITDFIICTPVIVDGRTIAFVVATQPIIEGLTPYVAAVLRLFLTAAFLALVLTFIIVYFTSYRLTKPLRQMSAAARQYASGDFSARIPPLTKVSLFNRHDEIDELVQAFNTMAHSLATLEMSRRSFVANVSHELKTPMTTIGGFIDGILDGTIEEERQAQYLKVVSDEVKRLSRLVTGMLNMSKIEAGELDLKPQQFDISEMVFRTLLGFEQVIESKNIEIRGLENIGSNSVFADKDMINQVVYNLVDNAVKFTPEGGYIEVGTKADVEKVIVKIKNSGKGIPSEEIGKIFERFYKIDKSRSYDVKGAGLGLYLVKTIIELHRGQIFASSIEGEYTEFVFNIPLK